MNLVWERLADGVFRCRLPFLDVTVGLVYRRAGAMLIDTGTTLTEAQAIVEDVQDIADREFSHILLTHNHFDHVIGVSAFGGAEIHCAPDVAATMTERPWRRGRYAGGPTRPDSYGPGTGRGHLG